MNRLMPSECQLELPTGKEERRLSRELLLTTCSAFFFDISSNAVSHYDVTKERKGKWRNDRIPVLKDKQNHSDEGEEEKEKGCWMICVREPWCFWRRGRSERKFICAAARSGGKERMMKKQLVVSEKKRKTGRAVGKLKKNTRVIQ